MFNRIKHVWRTLRGDDDNPLQRGRRIAATTSSGHTVVDARELLKIPEVRETIESMVRVPRYQDSKNAALLASFTIYCRAHHEYRFWQALRNWSEAHQILFVDRDGQAPQDTFYWNDDRPDQRLDASGD